MTANVSDWVRFSRNGILYIGVVEYKRTSATFPYKIELVTTCGTLYEDEVLERRTAALGSGQ